MAKEEVIVGAWEGVYMLSWWGRSWQPINRAIVAAHRILFDLFDS